MTVHGGSVALHQAEAPRHRRRRADAEEPVGVDTALRDEREAGFGSRRRLQEVFADAGRPGPHRAGQLDQLERLGRAAVAEARRRRHQSRRG